MAELYLPHRHRPWADLFCGGLSLPLNLRPKEVFAFDVNPYLINFWNWMQRNGIISQELIYERSYFLEKRERLNNISPDGDEAAEIFYLLMKTCYNGLCRFSSGKRTNSKKFNTSFGKYKSVNFCYDFSEYKQAIAKWNFQCLDYSLAFHKIPKHSFLYLDPPYWGTYGSYYGETFGWEEQAHLAKIASEHPGPVVASNSFSPEMILLYSELGFDISVIEAPRSISCNGDRQKIKEILATRNI